MGLCQTLLLYITCKRDGIVKPNSHQTIFLTDFQRQTKIEKSVLVGRFFKKKSVGVTWKSVG